MKDRRGRRLLWEAYHSVMACIELPLPEVELLLRGGSQMHSNHLLSCEWCLKGSEDPDIHICCLLAAAAQLQVIRSNETMSKAAALEQRILRLLADKDPDNRKHCIRLLRTFEYRQHVCMVFEPLVSTVGPSYRGFVRSVWQVLGVVASARVRAA
jgi:hypothetical protein